MVTGSASAQLPPRDSVPPRADYRDLAELLQKLPVVTAPALDEARALWLAALPMSCLDRLQPRPGRGSGRANVAAETSGTRGGRGDSTGRGGGRATGGPAASNAGAGYFWAPTYSLVPDHDRVRAFWGCTDWHSAVASTWVTARLLERYPASALHELEREKLNAHLGKSNLEGEFAFFKTTASAINPIPSANQTGLFERPYGFAWLLELETELRAAPDTQAKRWASNVAPLAVWMADSLGAYLGKLVEPVRAGTQNNTALSMTLALDYASAMNDVKLRSAIVTTARKFYLADSTCATQSERVVSGGRGGRGRGAPDSAARSAAADTPNDLTAAAGRSGATPPPGGAPVISPCLAEAALMSRVLEQRAYVAWLDRVLPPLQSGRFAPLTEAIAIPTVAPPAALATERAR
ncbi:MAG: DUF2891 family protein, partial [Gemmatimonadaceae bacterium]